MPLLPTAKSKVKDSKYSKIIAAKALDLDYIALTAGTFGAFGNGTWEIIDRVCDPRSHPLAIGDHDPWRAPGPRRDFILTISTRFDSVVLVNR